MKAIIGVLACLAVALEATGPPIQDSKWISWMKKHNKHYEDDVAEIQKYAVWKSNEVVIKLHNNNAGMHGYTLGMNEYSDLAAHEFIEDFNGYKVPNTTNFTAPVFMGKRDFVPPEEVDWRDAGAVTAVKNQGKCKSCWAFSATGSLEAQHFLKEKTLVSLSEQNLIDCSKSEGNNGCKSGYMDYAFSYIKKNNGIDTEESYPYEAHDGFCRFKPSSIGATLRSYKNIQRGNVTTLTQAVAFIGPVSAAMDASHHSFHLYKSGVYNDKNCSSEKLDHAVLVVGYGRTSDGVDYFLIKNSYGPSWGMNGYAMIKRDSSNVCGLATRASFPIV